ncbi:MAG TPA: ABC transporter permease, partial [Aquirhabdus sp.]
MGNQLKPFSASRLTGKIAMRSLFRRPTSTIRIILLLAMVFILLTVSIAGSIIAKDTTTSWVEKAAGKNVVAIAHEEMAAQYEILQSKFFEAKDEGGMFDYLNEKIAISNETIQQLKALSSIVNVDARLILKEHVYEISNFTIDPETLATFPVGDKREGDSLIIGVEPMDLTGSWFLQGRFLENGDSWEAVVGDSVARKMFSKPLVQSLRVQNQSFAIVGVCLDPIDNGKVIYVPIKKLQQITGKSAPNIVFVELSSSIDRVAALKQIKERISGTNQRLTVIELDKVLGKSLVFLDSAWSTLMLLPLFALASATLCLIAYVMLAVDEQRQEFAILRAIGAKPKTIVNIVAVQSSIVLAS